MKVLVLGAGGMLGHRLCLEWAGRFDCAGTTRDRPSPALESLLEGVRLIGGVRVADGGAPEGVAEAIDASGSEVVVNCIGIVKQSEQARDPIASIAVNSLFPHRLAAICRERGVRLIQISTDCVFSGRRGGYAEDDLPDPVDLYGRSKLLGEPGGDGALTLRTSIIGRELAGSAGLLEWLISNRGQTVQGYRRAIFSGFTTSALAGELAALIEEHPGLAGLRHLSAEAIDKHALLTMLSRALNLGITVEPVDAVRIDRSLDSARLRGETGRRPPGWEAMISGLAHDRTPYDTIRAAA